MHRPIQAKLDAAFAVLADVTRREMLRALLLRPRRAGELADCVRMSPQALSRHLRLLRKTGFVVEENVEDDARVRLYRVRPGAFEPLQEWLGQSAALSKLKP